MPACGCPISLPSLRKSFPVEASLSDLAELIANRLALGADVAAAKFAKGGVIDDPAREMIILDWVAERMPGGPAGREAGIAFFGDQILASKVVQRGLHTHWRRHPEDFPGRWRGLAEEIRPQMDVINRDMLSLLPSVPRLSREQLDTAAGLLDSGLEGSLPASSLGGTRRTAVGIALRSLGQDR